MNSSHSFFRKKEKPLILGHRGVPISHQENTLSGFRKAVELGIDGVELDVFLTADDKAVVFHDEDIERLTGEKGKITEMTWDEISKRRIQSKIDMGHNVVDYGTQERIPLLEEVLDAFKDKLMINIEMKAYAPKWSRRHTGTEVARIIRKTKAENSVIITSFDFFMLYYLEREYPGLHSGFAYDDGMGGDLGQWFKWVPEISSEFSKAPGNQNDQTFLNFILEANLIGRFVGSTVVDAEYMLLDSDTISKFHDLDMSIGAYTLFPIDTRTVKNPLNEDEELRLIQRLISQKVDWMETDDPEKLKNIVEQAM